MPRRRALPLSGTSRCAVLLCATTVACGFDSSGAEGGTVAESASSASADSSAGPGATSSTGTSTATAPSTSSDPDDSSTVDPTSGSTIMDAESSSGEAGPSVDWWDIGWTKRRRIDLSLPAGVAGPLQEVPVLVVLDDTRIAYGELQPLGDDLRFVDADGTTVLSHDIERWDPGGRSSVWVKIPALDASADFIHMYWRNDGASAGVDAHGVWSPGYAAVYHLDDDPEANAPQILDSSAADRHATALGDMTTDDLASGVTTFGLDFDGSDDAVRIGPIDSDGWDAITVSAWVFHDSENDERAVSKAVGAHGLQHVFMIGADGGAAKARLRTDGGYGGSRQLQPPYTLPAGAWHHLAMTWSAGSGQMVLYVDGIEVDDGALAGQSVANGSTDVFLANANGSDPRYWNGILDEVRIEQVSRDGDWLRTQVAAMNDALAMFGAEEILP